MATLSDIRKFFLLILSHSQFYSFFRTSYLFFFFLLLFCSEFSLNSTRFIFFLSHNFPIIKKKFFTLFFSLYIAQDKKINFFLLFQIFKVTIFFFFFSFFLYNFTLEPTKRRKCYFCNFQFSYLVGTALIGFLCYVAFVFVTNLFQKKISTIEL